MLGIGIVCLISDFMRAQNYLSVRVAPHASRADPNPRNVILCKHKMYIPAVWPLRLVVQDIRFSS